MILYILKNALLCFFSLGFSYKTEAKRQVMCVSIKTIFFLNAFPQSLSLIECLFVFSGQKQNTGKLKHFQVMARLKGAISMLMFIN